MLRGTASDRLAGDLRHAVRTLRKSPAFTAIAVMNLALGIGVNTAVYSVIHAVLFRPAPYAQPERLVTLTQAFPKIGEGSVGVSPAEYLDYRDRARAFAGLAGHQRVVLDLTGGREPLRIGAERATHTLFPTLGIPPLAGRTFSAAEDSPRGPHVIVLSYELWQRLFAGSAAAIGAWLRLNEQPHTVIGVMPAGFQFPFTIATGGEPPAAWVPMAFTDREIADRAASFPVHIVARQMSGVPLTSAQRDVERVAQEFQQEHPEIYTGNLRLQVRLDALGNENATRAGPMLAAISGAVVFVLLIACANVTNLLLGRAASRQGELAVRSALGASAGRLAAQLLVEALLLTAAGATLGCLLALALVNSAPSVWPWSARGLTQVRVDGPVLAFTAGVSAITAILCGVVPALQGTRPDVIGALKNSGRQGAAPSRRGVRSALVIVEAASAVILLIAAGLLVHSFIEVLRVPAGFSPDGVLIARTTFNRQRYPSDDRRSEVERLMTARLAALPGVSAVAVATHIPLGDDRKIGFILEGEDLHAARWADNALVTGSYFAAMGIPLLRGTTFADREPPGAPLAAIVNDSMARRFWPDADAVGKRIVWGGRTLTIVGVASDVRVAALDTTVGPTIYTPLYQTQSGATTSGVFIVRSRSADGASLASAVRGAIWSVDPDVPVFEVRTMNDVVSGSLATRRFAMALLSGFALLALALAMLGLHGVLSYAVTQRTPELGVRVALGASSGQILRLVLGDGLRLLAVGVTAGGCIGALVARAMSRLLFGIGTFDVAAFTAAALALMAAGLVAAGVPARRAARVDPVIALRSE